MARQRRFKGSSFGSRNPGGKNPRLLIILVIISFILMTVSSQFGDGFLRPVRDVVHRVSAPLASLGSAVSRPMTSVGNVATNITADGDTLTQLREENTALRATVEQLEEYRLQSQRLTELLGLRDVYGLSSTAARVIGVPSSGWDRTITIDKGSSDGVTSNMPVLTASGVIGQTITAEPDSSVVRLLTSENSGVSALIQSSRAQGILRGSADGTLHLDYIPVDTEVVPGDVIMTSGLGGVYPKGLVIGEVVKVDPAPGGLHLDIVVKPNAEARNAEEVLVITELAAASYDVEVTTTAEPVEEGAETTTATAEEG